MSELSALRNEKEDVARSQQMRTEMQCSEKYAEDCKSLATFEMSLLKM
jgi:hypothetical protein